MKIKLNYLIAVIIIAFTFTGCAEDAIIEPPPIPPSAQDIPVRTIADLPADTNACNCFTYFRMEDSSIVRGADTLSSRWDLAFKGTTIWVNGGPIRIGNGGAIMHESIPFEADSIAPTTGYAVDDSTGLAIRTGSGNGWYNYEPSANLISPIPGRVFIIRTGEGNYSKVQFLSYYQGGTPNPSATNFRFYTFKYVYQDDGSTDIK